MKKNRKVKISTLGSRITSAISVALALILLGVMAMAMVTSHKLAGNIRSNVGLVVRMIPEATDAETARVKAKLTAMPSTATVTFTSADSILSEESRIMGEDIAAILDQNPFGGEFEIKVKEGYAVADSLNVLAERISADEAVDEVSAETGVVENVNSALDRAIIIIFIIAVAMFVISVVLIRNTVSLSVYSRRFIIHTMKLVGATGAFIRRPFLRAGAVTGMISSIAAIAVVVGIWIYSVTFDPIFGEVLDTAVMVWIFIGMFIAGTAVCLVASALATNKYLRADYDDMFKH